MAQTYRDIAMTQMLGTAEDAMREVLDCWAELPPPMRGALDEFRARLATAIDSVDHVKRALDRDVHEAGERLAANPQPSPHGPV